MSSQGSLEIELTELPISDTSNLKFIQKFEEQLHDYDIHHQGSFRRPWTKERILEVISYVKHARVSMVKTECRTSMSYYWLSKYDFMTSGNEEYLIFKRKNSEDPIIRIIPREEYFNILNTVHEELGHGGRDKMASIIKSQFYITKKAIEIFVSLCPKCNTKRNISKKGTQPQDFNIQGQVNLIDFQSCPDGEYKWLLTYQDNATKFLNLRPLKTKLPSAVSMELMKIFLIFGPPCFLQSDSGQEFTENVIKELVAMWPCCKIVHGSPKHPQTQDTVDCSNQDVKNMIRSWMTEKKSTNWSVGCYFCQYQKNTSIQQISGKSPYKAMFGNDPKAINITDIKSHKRLKRAAEKMVENAVEELPTLPLGNSVSISTPKEDHGPLDTKIIKQDMHLLIEKSDDQILNTSISLPLDTKNVKQELDPLVEGSDEIFNTSISLPLDTINIKQDLDPLMESYDDKSFNTSTSLPLDTKSIKQEPHPLRESYDDESLNTSISLPLDTINIRQDLDPLMESCDGKILNTSISSREAVTNVSKIDGKGFLKCWCKAAQLRCRTMRCTCFRKRVLCGAKCHISSSCVNV